MRQEIEAEVMNQASAAAWRILTDLHSSDVAFNIADKVRRYAATMCVSGPLHGSVQSKDRKLRELALHVAGGGG